MMTYIERTTLITKSNLKIWCWSQVYVIIGMHIYYTLVKGDITVVRVGATNAARQARQVDKQGILKNCTSFTDCITKINNTQVGNWKDVDVLMSMYSLIEYSNNYSKTFRNLYYFCRDVPHATITDSES